LLRFDRILAALACLAFGVWLAATVPVSLAMGWDESMHVMLPAARLVEALRAGEIGLAVGALLDCAQYPPAWPAVLALVELPGGVSEGLARAVTSLAWAAALLVVGLLARRAARASGRTDPRIAAWSAMILGALCPLAASFAGTLFLEVPSALATAFALWAWTRRADRPHLKRELVAGLAVTLALFTKWNYGLLLGAALALDWACEAIAAQRAGRARELFARTRWLVAIPLLASAWWFVLPLPGGFDQAREHREAFLGFLAGNLIEVPTPAAERVLYVATGIAPMVVLAILVLVLGGVALRCARTPAVRVLVLAAAMLLGAPLAHPFFLDRFLIPGLVPLFALAGLGFEVATSRARIARYASVVAVAAVVTVAALAALTAGRDGPWLADRLGLLPAAEPGRGYVTQVLRDRVTLGSDRRLPSGGLERAEHDALLDLVAAEVRPGERVGWIGMSSEMSPAALHLGLRTRGRDPSWFLERAPDDLDLAYFGATDDSDDPGTDDSELLAFAGRFDVIVWTDPIDLRERRERAFAARSRDRLLAIRPSAVRELGIVAITRPLRGPLAVRLFSCRNRP